MRVLSILFIMLFGLVTSASSLAVTIEEYRTTLLNIVRMSGAKALIEIEPSKTPFDALTIVWMEETTNVVGQVFPYKLSKIDVDAAIEDATRRYASMCNGEISRKTGPSSQFDALRFSQSYFECKNDALAVAATAVVDGESMYVFTYVTQYPTSKEVIKTYNDNTPVAIKSIWAFGMEK